MSNSIVRIIQQQHALRTPKQPKKATRQPLKPIEQPAPEPPAPIVNEPIVAPPLADTPKPTTKATPLGAVAAVLLFVLMGTFGVARGLMAMDHEPPVRTEFVAHASGSDVVNVAGLGAEEGVLWSALGDARGRGIGERGLLSDPAIETLPETCGGVTAKARNLCGEPWLTVGRFDDT